MNPVRLLQVSAFFPAHGGGVEGVAGALAAHLAQAGVQVHWSAGGARAEWPLGLPGVTLDTESCWDPLEPTLGLPCPIWSPFALVRLWRRVGACNVVHVHDYLYLPTLAAMIFAALRRKPVVLTQHVGEIGYRSRFARSLLGGLNRSLGAFVLSRVAQTVFVGRTVQSYFETFVRFQRLPMLISNGVDHHAFPPALEGRQGELRLLFVGRFVEKKGLRWLQACAPLPGAEWVFAGSGPLAPPTGPGVRCVGRVGAADVARHCREADLLVLPSTGEGFPLVVQEALSSGTPVLVSTEVAEAFPSLDERCIFHVELRVPDPSQALRERLLALLADPASLRAARSAAVEFARQWDWAETARRYTHLYSALAEAQSHAATA